MSKRRDILSAVVARVATVSGLVYVGERFRSRYGPDELPAAVITAAESAVGPGCLGEHEHTMTVEITVMVSGTGALVELDALTENILAALRGYEIWGGLADSTEPKNIVIASELTGDFVAGANITLDIIYRVPRWNY